MKYLKHIFENVRPESDYEEMLDNILTVNKIIDQDIEKTFENYDDKIERKRSVVMYLTEQDILEISNNNNPKYEKSNRDYYLTLLADNDLIFNNYELSDCTLRYEILLHTIQSPDIPNDLKLIIKKLQKKYNYVNLTYRHNNITEIEIHYNLQDYVNLIGNNYKKINK